MEHLERLLKEIEPFPKNQRKVSGKAKLGKGMLQTFHLGVFQKPFSSYIGNTKYTSQYPELWEALLALGKEYNFPFSSATINKDLVCEPHKDSKNVGNTLIVGLGDYTGGGLGVEYEDGTQDEIDINHKPLIFDGKMIKHWTNPFQGTRYSVMLYHNVCFKFYPEYPQHEKIVKEVIRKCPYQKRDFKIEPYEQWIDCGGNIGAFSFRCLMNGAKVKYFCEPDANNIRIMRDWFSQRNVEIPTIIEKPLGISTGEKRMFYRNPEKPWLNSLYPNKNKTESWVTEIQNLQELISEGDCIKMDIEGAEIDLIDNTDFTGVKKMVIAYHIERDRSKSNLLERIEKLKQYFTTVKCANNLEKLKDPMKFFPNELFVFCQR
jgi:FkbM family methyltransferase